MWPVAHTWIAVPWMCPLSVQDGTSARVVVIHIWLYDSSVRLVAPRRAARNERKRRVKRVYSSMRGPEAGAADVIIALMYRTKTSRRGQAQGAVLLNVLVV